MGNVEQNVKTQLIVTKESRDLFARSKTAQCLTIGLHHLVSHRQFASGRAAVNGFLKELQDLVSSMAQPLFAVLYRTAYGIYEQFGQLVRWNFRLVVIRIRGFGRKA